MTKGIDVSWHQGKIDWKKVKGDNIDFAILRAGYGNEASQKDEQFDKNYAGCKENNIYTGAYLYSYAMNPDEARQEVETCIDIIQGRKFEYPIYFDIEDKSQLASSGSMLQRITAVFCDTLETAGYWVGIYSYKSFLEANFTPDFLARYAIWVAHTEVVRTNFKHKFGIWQYSHKGSVNGIDTDVDMNYCYTEYPEIMESAGLNGFSDVSDDIYAEHIVLKNE